MMFVFLKQGNLLHLAELNELDTLSVVIASICHDFAHDGLNNAYHVNAISSRAVRYNDQSVQENFHVAESFAIINSKRFNFL
jgi:HD superfamily phosphohydrolase YqeK